MEQSIARQSQVHTKTTARLPAGSADIVVPARAQRKATQQGVTVPSSIEVAVLAEVKVHSQLGGDEVRLVFFLPVRFDANDFL